MRLTAKNFFEVLSEECRNASKNSGLNIVLDKSKEEEYLNNCDNRYEAFKSVFMVENVKNLDRHKVAAILAIEAEALDIIHINPVVENGKVFIGQEKIILYNAINYVRNQLNNILQKIGLEPMKKMRFPTAFSCKTGYIDILCRNLFYTKDHLTDNNLLLLAEMELAEKFFLLEYISIFDEWPDNAANVYSALKECCQTK